jgi:hypothetical protein
MTAQALCQNGAAIQRFQAIEANSERHEDDPICSKH